MSDNLNALYEKLLEAQENGEVITMIYSGGSMAGQPRDVAPIKVSVDRMRARCYTTDAVKMFKLDKISVPAWGITSDIEPELKLVVDDALLESLRQKIEAKGYYADTQHGLVAHKKYKNGKVQKAVKAGVFIFEGEDRSYTVSGPGLDYSRTFKYDYKAFKLFVEQIELLPDLT